METADTTTPQTSPSEATSRDEVRVWAVRVAVAVVAAYVVLVLAWGVRPLQDSVPVGVDRSPTLLVPPQAERRVSQDVACNTLFASAPRGDEPLPALTPQPPGQPALEFQREPCELVHSQARVLMAANTAVALLLAAGAVTIAVRRR